MFLSKFSVARPVTIKMFVAGIVLLGMISLGRLRQDLFPSIEYPQLTVVTEYKGAAPAEIEMLITRLIEESVGTVSGVKNIRSVSKEEQSMVMVELDWGTDMDLASMALREKIDLIKERLPRGSAEPLVVRYNPFELPVMIVNVTGDYNSSDLLEMTKLNIKSELEKINGVASCVISGGSEKEIQINVDAARLNAAGLTLNDVVDALKKSNLNYPAGTLEESFYEQMIRTVGEFESISEIANVPLFVLDEEEKNIKRPYKEQAVSQIDSAAPTLEGEREFEKISKPSRKVIFLKDIAEIKESLKEETAVSRFNGQDTVSLAIQKRAGANTVAVATAIRKRLKSLEKVLPEGLKVKISYDQSYFIKDAIKGVSLAAVQGGILAFFVLLFFLKCMRSSLIVSMCIPISVMAAFAAMYFKGVSLNMISLGGLALGIGMLVDNAIVVIENISRLRNEGLSNKKAASQGASEVASAIVASTVTTVIVFLPMIFVAGVSGKLFKELAFTVIASLLASLLVALTFIPALAAHWGGKTNIDNNEGFTDFENKYSSHLKSFIPADKFKFSTQIILVFFVSLMVCAFVDKELMPSVDQGQFVVEYDLAPGTSLSITEKLLAKTEKFLLAKSDVATVTVNAGADKDKKSSDLISMMAAHQGRVIVNLKQKRPWWVLIDFTGNYRTKGSRYHVRHLKKYLKSQKTFGAQIKYTIRDNVFAAAFAQEAAIAIEIKGYDLDYMKLKATELKDSLSKMKGVFSVRDSLVDPSPENRIIIDKDKAAVLGFSVSDIALLTQTALDGKVATSFKREGREIDIKVRLAEEDRDDKSAIRSLVLNSNSGSQVMLNDLAEITYGRGPTEIRHLNQERVVIVWADLDGRSVASASQEIKNKIFTGLDIEPDYSVALAGEMVEMEKSSQSLGFALLLSLVLVYMVMAGQFESFKQPFIIMFTIPLALIGVAAALFFTLTKLSIMAALGIIVLGGIVVNNGIVLVDSINLLRAQGLELQKAICLAAKTRLRPIVMTAATTILGLLPLAFGLSQGAKLQQPMAITVVGGLLISTFLSLKVVPALYYWFEK